MKRFYLVRYEDESGVSGVGVIAEGILFSNWMCILNWLTEHRSQGIYRNPDEMMAIHGHDGRTVLVFVDDVPCTPNAIALPAKPPNPIPIFKDFSEYDDKNPHEEKP